MKLITLFLLLLSLDLWAKSPYAPQVSGQVAIQSRGEAWSQPLEAGQRLKDGDFIRCGEHSGAALQFSSGIELWISENTSLRIDQKSDQLWNLNFNGIIKFAQTKPSPLHFQTSKVLLENQLSTLVLKQLKHSDEIIIDCTQGQNLIQGKLNQQPPQLKIQRGQRLLADSKILQIIESDLKEKQKYRVLFDFRKPSEDQEPNIPENLGQEQGESLQSTPQNLPDSDQKPQQDIQAKHAKIVAGQADGQSEYKYGSNIPWLLIIGLVIVLLSVSIFWIWKKRKKKDTSQNNSPTTTQKDFTENEDIFVFEKNLTSHDPRLITSKTTHILGNVEDDASIYAEHKLVVRGCFQGAQLHAKDNVTFQGGVNGQHKAVIVIEGDLKASYISDAKVFVSGNLEVEHTLKNVDLAVQGSVHVNKKSVLGGTLACASEIHCPILGSHFCQTQVLLGEEAERVWVDRYKLPLILFEHENDSSQPEDQTAAPSNDESQQESPSTESNEEEPQTAEKNEDQSHTVNPKAVLRVYEELVESSIQHGERKLDQKSAVPGPVETTPDLSQNNMLRLRGFNIEESNI